MHTLLWSFRPAALNWYLLMKDERGNRTCAIYSHSCLGLWSVITWLLHVFEIFFSSSKLSEVEMDVLHLYGHIMVLYTLESFYFINSFMQNDTDYFKISLHFLTCASMKSSRPFPQQTPVKHRWTPRVSLPPRCALKKQESFAVLCFLIRFISFI